MSTEIEVREAKTAAERELVYGLRYEVYVQELGLYEDVGDHERQRLSDSIDDVSRLVMATIDGELVGSMRATVGSDGAIPPSVQEEYHLDRFTDLVPLERMGVFTRFFVRPDHRGSAAPIELLREVLSIAAKNRLELAFCDCESHLVSLYTGLGFRSYCPAFHDENLDLLFPLILVIDPGYLESIRSPLLELGLRDMPPTRNREALLRRLPMQPPVKPLDLDSIEWAAEFERLSSERPGRDHILAGLHRDEVEKLVARSHVIELEPGAGLIRRGQASRNMFVILEGTLEIHDDDRLHRVCHEGEIVGDIAFLLRVRRTIGVRAGAGGARVLSVSERSLSDLIDSQSRTAALFLLNLARTGARRLANSSEF